MEKRNKIKTIAGIKKICAEAQKGGKKIALVTGCFDIIHADHVKLLRFAKQQADLVIVGLDNDISIKLSKGSQRPIFNLRERARMLSEMESVDYIFPIFKTIRFDSPHAEKVHTILMRQIKPTFLITNPLADRYWQRKKRRAQRLGITFLPLPQKRTSSSTLLIKKLAAEL